MPASRLTIGTPPRRLEAVLHEPAVQPTAAAIVCHPHPQYGGDMDNPVVVTVADALVAAGYAVLRFNFGGVGDSEGTYDGGREEQCDVGAAEATLAACMPLGTPIVLAGADHFLHGFEPSVARAVVQVLGEAP